MATRGQTELTKCERRAREAIDAMQNDQIWKLGEFTTNVRGRSIQATIANEFCNRYEIEKGDDLTAFMHLETGALVFLPTNDE